MMIRSGSLNAGDKIVYGYRYRKDFQRGEDIMYKKGICRHIVPILTVLALVVSSAGPVQAVDSIAEIMTEDSEKVLAGEPGLIIEDAADAEEVLDADPDSIIENASETDIVPAEDPDMVIDETSDAESSTVDDPDSIADNTLEDNREMQSEIGRASCRERV